MTDIGSGDDALPRLLGEHDGGGAITLKRVRTPHMPHGNHAYHPNEGVIRVSATPRIEHAYGRPHG